MTSASLKFNISLFIYFVIRHHWTKTAVFCNPNMPKNKGKGNITLLFEQLLTELNEITRPVRAMRRQRDQTTSSHGRQASCSVFLRCWHWCVQPDSLSPVKLPFLCCVTPAFCMSFVCNSINWQIYGMLTRSDIK